MKNPEKKKRRSVIQLHLWKLTHLRQALSYLTSVMGTLRETRLEALACDVRRQRLVNKPGRQDRSAIIAIDDAKQQVDKADERFMDDLLELQRMSVFLMDPVKGLALIPFLHGERVAWYVFDLFAEEHLQGWRYQEDPLETRRPMSEVDDSKSVTPMVA